MGKISNYNIYGTQTRKRIVGSWANLHGFPVFKQTLLRIFMNIFCSCFCDISASLFNL